MASLSNSIDYQLARTEVITLALKRVNAIGQGETPDATTLAEAAVTLNVLVKSWEADGMPLWKLVVDSFTPTATNSFTVGVGSTVNKKAPLKVHRMWYRNTATSNDTPLVLITKDEYYFLGNKSTTGTPNQVYYDPPGAAVFGTSSQNMQGTFYVYPSPDAAFVAANTIFYMGQLPFEDFDAASDYPDFPTYWTNALAWGLADQLAFEYGLPDQHVKAIQLKSIQEKQQALSFGSEEGSVFFTPNPRAYAYGE